MADLRHAYRPEEDAALMPYVDRVCDWGEVLPRLPGRSRGSLQIRLAKLRRAAGTLWTIDQRPKVAAQPRDEAGRMLKQRLTYKELFA